MRRPGGQKTYEAFSEAAGHDDVTIRLARSSAQKKRDAPFSLRLSERERAELLEKADGLPLSAYIKSQLFSGAQYRSRARQVDREALGRVLATLGQSRIPQNLNQIAKAAHMGALPVTPELLEELNQTCAVLKAMRQEIMAALGYGGRAP